MVIFGNILKDLRAKTQGRGTYTFKVVRYDEVPGAEAKKIIEAAKADMDED